MILALTIGYALHVILTVTTSEDVSGCVVIGSRTKIRPGEGTRILCALGVTRVHETLHPVDASPVLGLLKYV